MLTLHFQVECTVMTEKIFLPHPSVFRFIHITLVYFFSVTCVFFLQFPFNFICFLLLPFLYYFTRDEKIISLQYDKKREWILQWSEQKFKRATLLGSSVILRYLVILHFRDVADEKQKIFYFFSDSFSQKDFQSLRRCMKNGFL